MATVHHHRADPTVELREELNALRDQFGEVLTALKSASQETSHQVADKLESGLNKTQEKAKRTLHDAYEFGAESVKELGGRVQRNPVASLAIAFGAGYLISRISRPE